jgi:DNA polymerase-3 subunit epsilon
VAALAATVDELAERRRAAESEVAERVRVARTGLEQERNRLAALMAELAVAVVVCNVDGRILLYNDAARSLADAETVVGIGRSVYGLVDRELIEHAVARLSDPSGEMQRGRPGADSHVATTVRGGRVLQVRVATVPDSDGELAGYVLLFEDLTDRMSASGRRNDLHREFTESARAALGSIRAAIETVIDYPDMEPAEREQFTGIVREEAERLGDEVQRWASESAAYLAADWPLSDISTTDLASLVAGSVERSLGLGVAVAPPSEPLWVKADSHALGRSFVHLLGRLGTSGAVGPLALTVRRTGGHAEFEVAVPGEPPSEEELRSWMQEPLTGGAAPHVEEVVRRHGGELWAGGAAEDGVGGAHLKLLLPLTRAAEPAQEAEPAGLVDLRPPEFYDFGLFDRQEQPREDWHARRLEELTYTVLDTETTGLEPTRGDEIISVGAVRVVNGRLLRQESFERLVDPGRPVPASSTAVHGLTGAMLAGQPSIDQVLPELERFAADTVLVGHNVGFDLQFLRLKEERTGVRFDQPVLDTLLLDAVAHPDHEQHSLEAIAARLGVPVVARHSALGDALVTGEVFLRLVPLLREQGLTTLGDVLAASRSTLQARLGRRMYDG